MFSLFKPRALPSAREVAIMIPLGLKTLELERSHKAEKQLAVLRKRAHREIEKMLSKGYNFGSVLLHDYADKESVGERFEIEAIAAFEAELKALGYVVIAGAGEMYLNFRVPDAHTLRAV